MTSLFLLGGVIVTSGGRCVIGGGSGFRVEEVRGGAGGVWEHQDEEDEEEEGDGEGEAPTRLGTGGNHRERSPA